MLNDEMRRIGELTITKKYTEISAFEEQISRLYKNKDVLTRQLLSIYYVIPPHIPADYAKSDILTHRHAICILAAITDH